MLDKIVEKSPAKINLFLKIINKREDGFHNIRTGVTYINLFDEITVQPNKNFKVNYYGKFIPIRQNFNDCIIFKLFDFLQIKKPNLLISINKNIPFLAGLGSASSNAATVIKILENLEVIEKKNIFEYSHLGSDIPLFLREHDCLVRGRGDLLTNIIFPKYFFLLIKPNINCSTKKMYHTFNKEDYIYNSDFDLEEINDFDNGNDFENKLFSLYPKLKKMFDYMQELEGSLFTRVTGSGSSIYSVFESKKEAELALIDFKKNYTNVWSVITENNFI